MLKTLMYFQETPLKCNDKKILVTLVLLKVISVVKTLFTLNKKKGDHFFGLFKCQCYMRCNGLSRAHYEISTSEY